MGIITNRYIRDIVRRYDKEVGIPYYSYLDFKGLHQDPFSFVNSKGIEIHCFYYYYDNYQKDKVILFCHGMGPGHTAYLAEIENLAQRGYRVLTLDYTGCGESKGERLLSLNMPTLDVMELLDYLKLKEQVILVGHSLGGYTALNVINLRSDIDKAVIISGFLSIESLISNSVHSKFIISRLLRYEQKTLPNYSSIDNVTYLKNTNDKILFIHSKDDPIVKYLPAVLKKEGIDNPSLKTLSVDKRKHNPNYTDDAVNYLNDVFNKFNELINKKVIKTDDDKINYFKDISIIKLTKQDKKIFDEIISFIS